LGGGIYFEDNTSISFDPENRSDIFLNTAISEGSDLYSTGCEKLPIIVDTFTVLHPTAFFSFVPENFEFDIWNYKLEQGEYDIYVSPDGSNDNTGTSPDDPLLSVSTALFRIMTDSVPPFIIHLSPGIYSQSTTGEDYPLIWRSNTRILGADSSTTILDGGETQILNVIGSQKLLMEDLTLRNGNNGTLYGGGGYIENANISFKRIGITACYSRNGGAFYINGNSQINFEDVRIVYNQAKYGAGIYCVGESVITGKNIQISNNLATSPGYGGGIHCLDFTGELTNLNISNNEAGTNGGGFYCDNSSPYVHNMLLSENSAYRGGGVYCRQFSNPKFNNLSTVGNTATIGGAFNIIIESSIELTNSIVWNNDEKDIFINNGGLSVRHSDIEGGEAGIIMNEYSWLNWLEGNLDTDPLFIGSGEYPYALSDASPCIDAGTPDTTGLNLFPCDIIGNERIWDGNGNGTAIIDMGAYEYGATPVGKPKPIIQNSKYGITCYPNPVRGILNIEYRILNNEVVELGVFDIYGKKVATLVNESQTIGKHKVQFNISGLSVGLYLIHLQSEKVRAVEKILVVQ